MRKQIELLKDHAHLTADQLQLGFLAAVARAARQTVLADAHRARVKRLQPIETAQKSALPATRRPDDHGHFAFGDGQRNAAQHLQRAVPFAKLARFNHGAVTGHGGEMPNV